ncbi:hypothetical protein QR680_009976 [Steinernema hermaphroditum]|uniref:Uncharacterized protein n=1 Tax=Steinernema hermaphroditum TaxID=289476 RepID=A0AA39MAV8_9BILA|nr:hypothetical protein QR680_009976 [Steinernema hermaphroditum]
MDAVHSGFGAFLIGLTVLCLPVYIRILYIFVKVPKYRKLQCYRIMAQQGVTHCLMAPYFLFLGVDHFLGYDLCRIGQTSLKLMGACLRSEAIFGFVLALDRLKLICDLTYPKYIHTLLCLFSWCFGATYFSLLMTPNADFTLNITTYSSYFDSTRPYSAYIQQAGYCLVLSCCCLTFLVYSTLVVFLLYRRYKQKLNATYFKEKWIFLQALVRFAFDLSLTILYNFGSSIFGPSVELRIATTICYILNYLFLPPLLYIMMISCYNSSTPLWHMDAVHYTFGASLLILTAVCLPVYMRVIYIFVAVPKYRRLQCYHIMTQQAITHCLMAPYFVFVGIGHFIGDDFYGVGQTSLKLMAACLRSEAIFGFVLALDRLKLICDLRYPNLLHTSLCIFSWCFGIAYFSVLMTPKADFTLNINTYSSYFDNSKPYSSYIQQIGYCTVLVCYSLTFIIYSTLVAYLLHRRYKQMLNANYFKEKWIFLQALVRFAFDLILTIFYNFGSSILGHSTALKIATSICYILNYLFLPPLLYVVIIR